MSQMRTAKKPIAATSKRIAPRVSKKPSIRPFYQKLNPRRGKQTGTICAK